MLEHRVTDLSSWGISHSFGPWGGYHGCIENS